MQKALLIKIAIVLLLAMLINIPLGMMSSLVNERQGRQNQVATEIANSYAEPQLVTGPLLVFPYTEEFIIREEIRDADGDAPHTRERLSRHSSMLIVPPHNLEASGALVTDIKKRSLFEVPVYTLDSSWNGSFEIPAELEIPRHAAGSKVTVGKPYLSLPVSDPRGFAAAPVLEMDGITLKLEQGSGVSFAAAGVKATLEGDALRRGVSHPFKLSLKLRGTSQLRVIPLADNMKMELTSNWQHPGFDGRFLPLPETQHVGADGFRANWEVSSLASNSQAKLTQLALSPSGCDKASCLDSFEVRLVNPVSIYHQAERALKYGFLFIGITFMAFFLFEILKRLAIHPAQYTLVGLAQAMFFLLLLSFSEHIDFTIAYVVAAVSCVVLVGYYLGHVMRGTWRGAGFASLLGACYAALYGLLVSEDNALLMGSLLLFVLLAMAMIVTRNFDWYDITATTDKLDIAQEV
jgi:inner membrane protein